MELRSLIYPSISLTPSLSSSQLPLGRDRRPRFFRGVLESHPPCVLPRRRGGRGTKEKLAAGGVAALRGEWADSGPSLAKDKTEEGGGGRCSGTRGRPRPVHPQGPTFRGSRSASILAGGAGSGVWVPLPSRLSPGADADSGAVPLAEWRSPVGASRDTSPSPTGLVPSGSQVPPRGPDKMEDVVSSRSHHGLLGDYSPRGEARVDMRPSQEHSGGLLRPPPALRLAPRQPLPGGPHRASRSWTGRALGTSRPRPSRGRAVGSRGGGLGGRPSPSEGRRSVHSVSG